MRLNSYHIIMSTLILSWVIVGLLFLFVGKNIPNEPQKALTPVEQYQACASELQQRMGITGEDIAKACGPILNCK
jgi:hypothetical protein